MKQIDIDKFLSLDGYATDERKGRRKGTAGTQEFYTPVQLVKRMSDKISDDIWKNPEKTFCEPSFGSGQFVVYIVYRRLISGISWKDTLSALYGVELMPDNVKETKQRILSLLDLMEVQYDREEAIKIMDKNLVCSDFFKWDFENWKPLSV